jgi:hypothetical protein
MFVSVTLHLLFSWYVKILIFILSQTYSKIRSSFCNQVFNIRDVFSLYGCLDEQPVFGVPLEIAVERSHCHDGVDIPVVVRDCIDYVQEHGM